MKEIPLTRGYVALVDDEDYDELSKFSWQVIVRKHTCYAQRGGRKSDGEQGRTTLMHIQLLGRKPGHTIDHKNGNGLDNQRHNLRHATKSQQLQNAGNHDDKWGSKFKGVTVHKPTKSWKVFKWHAYISVNKTAKSLGYFDDETEAARAYDAAAKKYFGEFARLNFPMEVSNAA